MDNLTGIVAFVRTAEALSFVAAGRALGISASAVGKTIAKLEQSLGVRLFNRTTRRVTLTEEGRHFYERCQRILEDFRDAEATVTASAQRPRGRLRVSLPVIGYRFLLPVLPEFRQRYPDVELDLDFNDRMVDVVEGGFDAVIRSGPLSDSSLMSRRLGPFAFVLCATPAYRAGRHAARTARSRSARMRALLLPDHRQAAGLGARGRRRHAAEAAHRADLQQHGGAARHRARETGIGYMPDFLARDALEQGTLVTVLDDYRIAPGQFSIVWPSSRQLSPKLRVFVDFLCERLFR